MVRLLGMVRDDAGAGSADAAVRSPHRVRDPSTRSLQPLLKQLLAVPHLPRERLDVVRGSVGRHGHTPAKDPSRAAPAPASFPLRTGHPRVFRLIDGIGSAVARAIDYLNASELDAAVDALERVPSEMTQLRRRLAR